MEARASAGGEQDVQPGAPYHGQLHQEESPSSVCSAEGGGGVGGGTKRYWKGLSAPMPRGETCAVLAAGARGRVSGLVRVTGSALHLNGPHVLRVVDADRDRPGDRVLPAGEAHRAPVHIGAGRVVDGLEHRRQRHVQRRRKLRRDVQVVDRLLVGDGQPEAGLAAGHKVCARSGGLRRLNVHRSCDAGHRCVQAGRAPTG